MITLHFSFTAQISDELSWLPSKVEEILWWNDAMDLSTQNPEEKDKSVFRSNIAEEFSQRLVGAIHRAIREQYGEAHAEEAEAIINSLDIQKIFSIE